MIEPHRLRQLARDVAPWVAAALGLQIGLHLVWPTQFAASLRDRVRAEELRAVVPDSLVLRKRVDSLRADSAALGRRLAFARSRHLAGPDPAAQLAARVVPLLGERGWKLDKVKADASGGFAVLDLGATANFASALDGLREIRRLPLSVRVRRLSLRPHPSGKLAVDLQIAVPTREAP